MLITDNAHGASVTKTVGYGAHFQASFFPRVCCNNIWTGTNVYQARYSDGEMELLLLNRVVTHDIPLCSVSVIVH